MKRMRDGGDDCDHDVRAGCSRGALRPGCGLGIVAFDDVTERPRSEHRVEQRVERAQRHRRIDPAAALAAAAGDRVRPAARVESLRVARAQVDRTIEPRKARFEIAVQPQAPSHREVRERIERVELDASLGVTTCGRTLPFAVVRVDEKRVLEVRERKPGVCPREVRRTPERRLEQRRGRRVVRAVEAEHVLQPEVIARPRIEVVGRHQQRAVGFVQRNADFERSDHAANDALAHVVDVVDRDVIGFRPDDLAPARFRKLDEDAKCTAGHFQMAGQAVPHAERAADFAHVADRAAKTERRAACDDEEPAQPGHRGDEVVRKCVRQRTGVAAERVERQHGDGRPRRGWDVSLRRRSVRRRGVR
jgi:hypothetical protein